jgi:hypothetical protein
MTKYFLLKINCLLTLDFMCINVAIKIYIEGESYADSSNDSR